MASCKKRAISDRRETHVRRPDDEDEGPARKKMRKALIEIFNRSSLCLKLGDERMSIFLRVKPFTKDDDRSEDQACFVINEEDDSVVALPPEISHAYRNMKRGLGKTSHKFTFSRVFDDKTNQAQFFNATMLDMTKEFISGQNSLVFTYGVTSSGKTYTLQGKPQDAGVLPRCLDVLFNSINNRQIKGIKYKPHMFTDVIKLTPEEEIAEQRLKERLLRTSSETTLMTLLGDEYESVLSDTMASCASSTHEDSIPEVENRDREFMKLNVNDNENFCFSIWVSFAEIYNEQIYDLLVPLGKKNVRRPTLKICDDRNGSPYIKGLREVHVESADEAYKLLTIGQHNLQTASTRLNQCSSRSHSIFTIKIIRTVDKDHPNIAKMNMLSLCDLAGSERSSQTRVNGDRLKEAGSINTSLMMLGRCIETLRYNQIHRDHPKMVPFRDSKLTRLFQNFFNGSGRAAMIVNVSQCASLFDDTLNVFKFSAIAKQVKYIAKPPEPLRVKKKIIPLSQRPSIPWEDPDKESVLEEASNDPLPEDDDEDLDETDDESTCSVSSVAVQQLEQQMKILMDKNAQLVEMLNEEVINSGNIELRVRKEVTDAMSKQMVLMEQTYSDMLKESREDAQETLEDQMQKIIDIYEEKLERMQHKVDDDDEWVSSCLYYREEIKVKERDEMIALLEKEKEKLKSALESSTSQSPSPDPVIASLKQELEETKLLCEKANDELSQQRKAMKTLQKETELKIERKNSTIKTLEEECQQMHEEIERLQDQMSQMDENSKRCEQDMSNSLCTDGSSSKLGVDEDDVGKRDRKLSTCVSDKSINTSLIATDSIAINTSQIIDHEEKAVNTSLIATDSIAVNTSQIMDHAEKATNTSQTDIGEKSVNSSFVVDVDDKSVNTSHDVDDKSVNTSQVINAAELQEIGVLKEENSGLKGQLEAMLSTQNSLQMDYEKLQSDKDKNLSELNSEISLLRTQVKELENANLSVKNKDDIRQPEIPECCSPKSTITEMVHDLERKATPIKMLVDNEVEDSPDTEIVFKSTALTAVKTTPVIEHPASDDLATKLKASELANTALRSKLKKEEDDFFKREQALIHGYSAEIDNLRLELAKQKCKTESDAQVHNKQKSGCKLTSHASPPKSRRMSDEESFCQDSVKESKAKDVKIEVLSSEVTSVREELLSSKASHWHLQQRDGTNDTNSFIHSVVLGTPRKDVPDQGVFQKEDNISDSVLQFEMAESALKIEELMSGIQQEKSQAQAREEKIKEMSKEKSDVEAMLKKESEKRVELEKEVEQKGAEMLRLQNELTDIISENEVNCNKSLTFTQNLESAFNEMKKENLSLKKEVEARAAKDGDFERQVEELNLKLQKNHEQMAEKSEELEDVSCKLHGALTAKSELSLELTQCEDKIARLEDELQSRNEELESKVEELNELYRMKEEHETQTETLESTILELRKEADESSSANNDLKDRLESKEEALSALETKFKEASSVSSDLKKRLEVLETEKAVAKEDVDQRLKLRDQDLEEVKSQLEGVQLEKKALSEEIEKMKELHQEESANVSQKLLQLEREKRLAEKKMSEALRKEQVWQMKCEDLGKTHGFEEQIRSELKTASESLSQHAAKTSELKEELASKECEITNLKRECEELRGQHEKLESLKSDLMVEKEEREKAESLLLESSAKLEKLRLGLHESEETMETQDKIMVSQDEKMKELESVLSSLSKRKDDLGNENDSLKAEISQLKLELIEKSGLAKQGADVEKENNSLKEELSQVKKELEDENEAMDNLKAALKNTESEKKSQEKELVKQERVNKRNREEMENWKKERDEVVKSLESYMEKLKGDNKELTHSNDKLKKDNADMAKNVANTTSAKDALIAELRKSNNTLSIQLASLQGLSPPPKMATPKSFFPVVKDFEEDMDKTARIEIDATPPIAAKKVRKWTGNRKNSSSVDPEDLTAENSVLAKGGLRTIEEKEEVLSGSERSPLRNTKNVSTNRLTDVAKEILSGLSPLTRSAKREQEESKRSRVKSALPPPFEPQAFSNGTENQVPGTRRSSRLRGKQKHSLV